MKNVDQYSSLFWFIAGIAISLSSLKYGIGSLSQPGAGFITFFPGIIISLLSAALFIASRRDRDNVSRLRDLWAGFDLKHVAYTILFLAIYILAFKPVGFIASTFLLLVFLFRLKSAYRLSTVLAMSIAVTIASYAIFALLLKTQLPQGLLGGIF
jgi:putative tricarboxylic transport membrane protein